VPEGVIQQTDTPLALYRQPANLFVAGFLGSPPMNLIHGSLRQAGEALIFKEARGGVIELKFADGARAEAKPFAGREVVAGVRPEDIEIITGTGRPARPRFQGLIDIVEPMGAEANVYIETGAHTLVSRTQTEIGGEEAGHRAQFEIDPAKVHLFDPETNGRIAA